MQTKKSKFLLVLAVAVAIAAMVVPAQAATWDTTLVYWNTTGYLYDLAVGDKLMGASDDTVRIFATRSSSPYEVMLFTDISSALPLSWRTDVVFNETGGTRGKAIGDVDRDGDNDLVYVRTTSPYQVRRVRWSGSAWVMDTLATLTSSSSNYDMAIGDADNDGYADDIIVGNSYHVFRIHWNGSTWDTTRILNGTSTTGTVYGVAIGDFDAAYAGNEIAVATYGQKVFRIRWTGAAWDTLTLYTHPSDFDFYDCAVGDFDASNPGDEIAINNGYPSASSGVYEVYGSGTSWTFQALYVPGSGWGSYGEIAVGDFFTTNPGAEIVATGGGTSPYRTTLVYGSGSTWYGEDIMTAGGSAYGVAVGDLNRHRPGNEVATTAYYKIWEAEQKLLNNDMTTISIDDMPDMIPTDAIVTLKATVRNNAEYTANAGIPVKLQIDGPLGYVYTDLDEVTTTNLPPGGTEQIIFSPDWVVPDTLCEYTIKVWTELPGDEVPANDTLTKVVTVYRAGGLVESFTDTTFPPPGWTRYSFDGGDQWDRYTAYYYSPPACARIYYDLPNNDWLITPRLRVVDGDKLKFWWRTQSTSYYESLYVRISTNADVSDTGSYGVVDMMWSNNDISWRERIVDLSSYAGQDIYIAFYYKNYNAYGVAIDNVSGPYFPPQIQVAPDSIYVESFPDSFFDVFFNVGNIGGGTLNYTTSLSASSPWATVHPTSGSLLSGEQDEDTLSINTTGMDGHYYDTLVVTSNSGEKATNLIPIHIWVRLIPDISVSPDSFAVGVDGNGTKDTSMFISNSGNGDLEYTIDTEEWSKFGVVWDGEPATRPHRVEMTEKEARELGSKGGDDPRRGTPPAKGQGGPDAFGYRWIDSDEAGGPVFNWIEINSIGTLLSISDDGNVGPFAIGFPFEFYGVTFDSFRVASNGFATFTSTVGNLTNDTIPNPPEPNNLLALMWDDLRSAPGGGSGNIYYHSNSERLVIEYDHVIRYGQTACPYTMEIILYPNGKIIYQYLQMGDGTCTYLNQSTIGIENGTGTDGLEVVFNANYVHDNLAIRFSAAPAWLVFSPEFGTVPPSETDTIDITFDATGILSGDFYGAFIITSNDPDTPVDTVPAHMTILVPDMTFTPASIETSGTEGQAPFDVTMDIGNAGAASLFFNIVEGVPWLSVSPSADTIPPGDPASTITLTIDCTNLYAGNYVGTLKIYSNDPDLQPYATYEVSLKVGPDPDIAISPESFDVGLYAGLTKDTTLTISNVGDGHLVWGTAIEEIGKGADTTLYEGFEGTFPPADWTIVNNDGGSMQWEQTSAYGAHTGTYCASCRWESGTLWNDDWLITPRISVGGNDTLSFWYRAYSATYPESLEIRLSTTTNDVSAFTTLLWAGSQIINSTWEEKRIGLGKYARGQVYIAFVYKGLDEFRIFVDDVLVQSFAGPWLVVDPLSGITNPHSNTGVKLSFSSIGYEEDKYANLWITSNDPDESPILVPVHMEILGPEYSITPPETLVIDALEDQYTDGYLYLGNYGGHAPLFYRTSDSVNWLSESPDTGEVPIDEEDTVTVTVDGYELIAGNYATKVYIKTNDFDESEDTIVVVVHVGPPPAISVDPDTLDPVQVLAGGTKDTTITISNTGDGHLSFEITTEETGLKLAGDADHRKERVRQILESNKYDYSASAAGAGFLGTSPEYIANGAPTPPGSPVEAKGETLFIQLPHDPSESWSFGTSDAGAGYKMYENFWDVTDPTGSIYWWGLCLIFNGTTWIAGNPNNLVFDVTFYSDPPEDHTLPTDVACTYEDVVPTVVPTGIYYTTTAGSFEMYFFEFPEMDPICDLPEGWVSIQSQSAGQGYDWLLWASAKTGDGFSYQQGATTPGTLYDRAMILVSGGAAWLSVTPEADTVDPHSSVDVTVHFDATNVLGGEKFGNVIIEHNAPDKGTTIVPVHMVVGGAQYAIDSTSMHMNALEDQIVTAYVTISNPAGQGPLSYKMTDPVAWLSENPDTAQIPPDGQQSVAVRVDAHGLIAGNYSTEIMVKTNAVNQQYDTIPVFVHVGPDAEVDIAPMNLNVGVIPGYNRVETLRVNNSGGGHLRFETSIESSGPMMGGSTRVTGDEETIIKLNLQDPSKSIAQSGRPALLAPKSGGSMLEGAGGIPKASGDTILTEGFEGGFMPPAGWSTIVNDPSYTWGIGTYSPHSGTYYADIEYDPSLNPQNEWFVTPALNLKEMGASGHVSFWWYMSYYWAVSPYNNYNLELWISADGGATWPDRLWYEDTVGVFTNWTWYEARVDIAKYCEFNNVKLGWRYVGTDGAEAAVDDIVVESFAPPCPFTVTPEADTIDPSSFIDLLVTFDGTAFEPASLDTLHCNLLFYTNDPDEALVTVPVTMWSARGDVTENGVLDIEDVVFLLNFLYKGGPEPIPMEAGDLDYDLDVDSDDVMFLISYLFLGGPPPEIPASPKGDENINIKTRPIR
jgi:hypothetical protein